MNLVETILVFAVIPLAIYGAAGLATLRPKSAGTTRYRPGQPWDFAPLWWTANPEGAGHHEAAPAHPEGAPTIRGGARGNW